MYHTARVTADELRGALRGLCDQPPYRLVRRDYDEYWRHRTAGALQPRFRIIGEFLQPEATVLDVGCGDGAMLDYLSRLKRIRGLGLDISTVAVEKARSRGLDTRVQTLSDLHARTPAGSFDHVVMSEVIEHVADPELLVAEGWDLARHALWLTFPNIAYFPHRLRLLAGRFPAQWVVFPGEHLRFWSIPDFRQWLRALGLPRPRFYPSNGLTAFRLHLIWPNLLANQIVVRLDKQ